MLSKLIDCMKFCGSFDLAFRGHDETDDSLNPGIFRGLVHLMADLGNVISNHLTSATVFKGTFKTVQNELLDCMFGTYREQWQSRLRRRVSFPFRPMSARCSNS